MSHVSRHGLVFLAILGAGPSGAPAADAARLADVESTVRFLASPELGGRAADEIGGSVAAAYIAARLEALGWLPAGDVEAERRSFYQAVPAVSARFDPSEAFVSASWQPPEPHDARPATARLSLAEPGARYVPDRGATLEVDGELLFAGFGIRAPELGRDDYAGADPHGKVVLVFSGEPGERDPASPWNGTRPTRHLPVSSKRALAGSLGAVALLVVPNLGGRAASADDLTGGPAADPQTWLGLPDARPEIPVIYLDLDAAGRLLEGSGFSLRGAAAGVEARTLAARSFAGRRVAIRLPFRDRRERTLRNVVARLGGASGLDGEVVLLGAHWDHLGEAGGKLHPGADDNASGIAALLAVAQNLKSDPPRGPREVVLAAWTAEERGLLGSSYFARHPVVPLERLSVAVNLDMLGRNNLDKAEYARVLQVIYSAGAPGLREIALAANSEGTFDLRFYPSLRFRPVSDHHSFYQAGVPIVYPFSGYHADYHQPSDTVDKVLFRRVAEAAAYVARLIRGLATHDGPIRIDPGIKEAPAPDPFETPYGG